MCDTHYARALPQLGVITARSPAVSLSPVGAANRRVVML